MGQSSSSSYVIDEEAQVLWDEVKEEALDKACSDSFYGSDSMFRDWFEVVAYWDFVNAGGDYDYRIKEDEAEHHKEYKRSMLEWEHGPFEKLWDFVTEMAEISYSQGGRFRCEMGEDGQPGNSPPEFFEYYFQYDWKEDKWESDEDQQKFNEFVDLNPIDYIPRAIQHYKEKGAISFQTDTILVDLLDVVCG